MHLSITTCCDPLIFYVEILLKFCQLLALPVNGTQSASKFASSIGLLGIRIVTSTVAIIATIATVIFVGGRITILRFIIALRLFK